MTQQMQKAADALKAGDVITVSVKRIGINGEGVGYYKKKAVFIAGALPGEIVKAKVAKTEPKLIYADLLSIVKKSPHRKAPECPVYETCGGCQLQHLQYSEQLKAKEEIIREAFRRYAGIADAPLRPILGMDEPWHYRNKAQPQLGFKKGRLITGLYAPGTHDIVDISGCQVQHPAVNRVISAVREMIEQLDIPVYAERKKTGVVRNIVARAGFATQEVQLTIVTYTPELPRKKELVNEIRRRLPEVVTIAQNVNDKRTSVIFGDKTVILWGRENMEESLGHIRFSLSPRSFFQLNPMQTVKLYDAVREAAALTGNERVVDAYCGTGTIGLWLAPYAREVRGVEVIPEAVEDARRNAERSGITNARFFAGKAEHLLPEWVKQGFRPDVVVVDPPRTGCDETLLQAVIRTRVPRFVYVSCNPSTLAKNCAVLLEGGYLIKWIQPVDMFPQTSHVECVILMVRKGA
jgi:23S rRNA (uracil1939-C5)-methyltransferase